MKMAVLKTLADHILRPQGCGFLRQTMCLVLLAALLLVSSAGAQEALPCLQDDSAALPEGLEGLDQCADLEKIREMYAERCAAGYGVACFAGAYMFLRGACATADRQVAEAMLKRACRLGTGGACSALGAAYARGVMGLGTDFDAARRIFETGCAFRHGRSCRGLGRLFQAGLGVEQDMNRARTCFEQACQWGDSISCMDAAELEDYGF